MLTKKEIYSASCAVDIGYGRKITSFDVFKQYSRSISIENPSVNRCHLKVWVYLIFNPNEMAMSFEIIDASAKSRVHGSKIVYSDHIKRPRPYNEVHILIR